MIETNETSMKVSDYINLKSDLPATLIERFLKDIAGERAGHLVHELILVTDSYPYCLESFIINDDKLNTILCYIRSIENNTQKEYLSSKIITAPLTVNIKYISKSERLTSDSIFFGKSLRTTIGDWKKLVEEFKCKLNN